MGARVPFVSREIAWTSPRFELVGLTVFGEKFFLHSGETVFDRIIKRLTQFDLQPKK